MPRGMSIFLMKGWWKKGDLVLDDNNKVGIENEKEKKENMDELMIWVWVWWSKFYVYDP